MVISGVDIYWETGEVRGVMYVVYVMYVTYVWNNTLHYVEDLLFDLFELVFHAHYQVLHLGLVAF